MRAFTLALFLFAVMGLPSLSSAQSQTMAAHQPPAPWEGDIWTRDRLTGDWGGARSALAAHGIDAQFRLSQYGQWVADGGVDTGDDYGGTVDYRVIVDGHKLGLWQGLGLNMHARTRFGYDVNADAGALVLPNAGLFMPLPGDYHGTDITGLTVSQNFPLFGGLANVTFGKLDDIDLLTGFFPHISLGQEGFWNVNALSSNMPWFGAVRGLSLYGGIAQTINQKYETAQSGFLVTGTENESTSWGSISDAVDDGVWMAGFHRFFWDLDDKMGYLMVFGGYSTREQVSNDPHDFVLIPGQGIVSTEQKEPWDVALYLYQDFWQAEGDPNRKATLFMGGTAGPDNPQFAQWNFFASVDVFGLMTSRPGDRMGVAGWWNGLSPNFKDLVSPLIDLRDTWGTEIYYNLEVTPWAHLTADLQLVMNERAADDIAVIPGVRFVVDM